MRREIIALFDLSFMLTLSLGCSVQSLAAASDSSTAGGTTEDHAINAMVDIAHQFIDGIVRGPAESAT